MNVGIVMLVHTAFDRAEQVARHWSKAGCPLVLHVDQNVHNKTYNGFVESLSDLPDVRFSKRHRCEWGTWGLVAATQDAAQIMLDEFPHVGHVFTASGSCMPLRPVQELQDYLAAHPKTDFIESVTTADVPWTMGGLDEERFTLRFPFSWRKNRFLFDKCVKLQRLVGYERKIPNGIVPHMGSQWWCLTRNTLTSILQDPDRPIYDAYFRRVWIPDESYFQTLVRLFSTRVESRSLTLSKFDYQGKPHIFYDDHLQLLRRSDCFVARKIWPYADRLYEAFLNAGDGNAQRREPNPGKIDRIFSKAVDRRVHGRSGLYMQSRFPVAGRENGLTCAPYSVFEGFSDLFEDFETWLAKQTGARVHGHLFAQEKAEFADGLPVISGALSDSAALRNYNPRAFLANLLWNTRGERQCFQLGPRDVIKEIEWDISKDINARISVIAGAWAVPLFKSSASFVEVRREAARLQQIESKHLEILKSQWTKAQVKIWNMAEFIEAPMEPLQGIIEEVAREGSGLAEVPKMVDLTGFGQFLQNLRNQGMHPYLMGNFPVIHDTAEPQKPKPKPYLVQ
ncbi:Core-2/I-Branching enzyme [Roseovarius albus]|uniref:Peptide O-xylosyltransferase n=1 Tax=Roseovarius albus TaxID=1247867 RepID=A0A1X6YUY0_9RHOB|nr:beta-1,6-N-acetylglucosaminyltransferase [Roseovarius albus]SLN30188.1 Core-2/I-Branching enzyme [Roseovarius albus]